MNYKKMIFVVLHSVALMALLTMSCPAQDKPVSVTVPYHQLNINVQYITVRINNKIDARLLVDTGASCTFLFKSLATRLHLGSDRRFDPNAPYVSLSNPPRIDRLNAMQIGNLTLHSVPVVIGYNEDNATHLPGGLDGILGMNILKNYALLLDSQKSTLTFWKGGKLSAMQRQQIGFDHSDAIPLLPGKGDERFLVQAQLGGKINENLLLDTGSPITHITASSASRLNLVSDSILQHASFYGTFVFHLAYLEPLKIGSLLTRLVVGYPDSDALPLPPLLGMDVMARYGVLFDFPAQKMYVRPQQQSMVTTPFITYPGEDFPLWQIKLNDNSSHLIGLNPGLLSQLAPEAIPGRKSLVAPPQAITAEETSTITSIIRFTDSALALDERQFQIGSLGSLASAFSGLVGWLGYDTLYRYAVQLDFSKKQMRWFSPGGLEGTNYIPPIAQRLPLYLTNEGYQTDLEVDGKSIPFKILLLRSQSSINRASDLQALKPQASINLLDPDLSVSFMRMRSIGQDRTVWNNPILLSLKDPEYSTFNILGIDFFQHFRVTLDFAGQSLYLEPDPNYKPEPNEGISFGVNVEFAADGRLLVIARVVPSPVSEAGIEVGDEIVTVNGLDVAYTAHEQIMKAFRKVPNAELKLVVLPHGAKQPKTVTLKIRKLL